MITVPSEYTESISAGKIPPDLLGYVLQQHQDRLERLNKLDRYYRGEHDILERTVPVAGQPNNKIVCNHARYITDMATSFLLGEAIKYSSKSQKLDPILERYAKAGAASVDPELAKDMSVFGVAVELDYYSSDDVPVIKPAALDPRNAFVVYDDTVEYRKLFGVHFIAKYDLNGKATGWTVHVYNQSTKLLFEGKELKGQSLSLIESAPHNFTAVPMTEYWNNEEGIGDFEPVLSLIDGYNLIQSDRVNDVERFVQAILFIKGFTLPDDANLKIHRLLIAPAAGPEADARWLANALNQADIEVVRKTLEVDIHKFSQVPALTDEHFAGQASGVSMKYKLMGLDQLTKIKERYMEKGLRDRLRLFCGAPNLGAAIDPEEIQIVFTHSLPANELEMAQMVQTLDGIVSLETRLSLLPFIEDAVEEAQKVQSEKQQAMEALQATMGEYPDGNREVTDGADTE